MRSKTTIAVISMVAALALGISACGGTGSDEVYEELETVPTAATIDLENTAATPELNGDEMMRERLQHLMGQLESRSVASVPKKKDLDPRDIKIDDDDFPRAVDL